jgi:hypothetical protein
MRANLLSRPRREARCACIFLPSHAAELDADLFISVNTEKRRISREEGKFSGRKKNFFLQSFVFWIEQHICLKPSYSKLLGTGNAFYPCLFADDASIFFIRLLADIKIIPTFAPAIERDAMPL